MTQEERDEQHYLRGERQVWRELLALALRNLGYDDSTNAAALIDEREDTIAQLRLLCDDFGLSNDWPDNMHLGDVIEKHVYRYLPESLRADPEPAP